MYGAAASALAEENSLGWAEGDNILITNEDYLMSLVLKVFIEKRNCTFNKDHTHALELPVRCYLKC